MEVDVRDPNKKRAQACTDHFICRRSHSHADFDQEAADNGKDNLSYISYSWNEKGKKAKADANVLTIEKCINFIRVDLKKMGPKEVEAVGAMLNMGFTSLFITDTKRWQRRTRGRTQQL